MASSFSDADLAQATATLRRARLRRPPRRPRGASGRRRRHVVRRAPHGLRDRGEGERGAGRPDHPRHDDSARARRGSDGAPPSRLITTAVDLRGLVDGDGRLLVRAQPRRHRQSGVPRRLPLLVGHDVSRDDAARVRESLRPAPGAGGCARCLPDVAGDARHARRARARRPGRQPRVSTRCDRAAGAVLRVGRAGPRGGDPGPVALAAVLRGQRADVPIRLHPLGQHAVRGAVPAHRLGGAGVRDRRWGRGSALATAEWPC